MSTPATVTTTSAGLKTYRGSCHCGAVRFEADFDPSKGTNRCNCSICTKAGWWSILMKPEAFRLLSGEEQLSDYSRSAVVHACFCKVCGVRVFGHGNVPEIGGAFYSVNLNCLDDVDLTGVPVRYLDGRANTWQELAVVPHVNPFGVTKR